MHVFTVGEGAQRCCGVGCVQLDVGSGCPIDVEVPVADGKLLVFDLLLGFDIIKKLGGVYMTRDGTVSFPQLDRPVCVAITIDKPYFQNKRFAEFDQNKRFGLCHGNGLRTKHHPSWKIRPLSTYYQSNLEQSSIMSSEFGLIMAG